MAVIVRRDGDRLVEDGHRVRFILPRRPNACVDRDVGGRQVRHFNVAKGDLSNEEARQYAARLADAPARAMAVFDVDRADLHPARTPARASFAFSIMPGRRITSDWCVVAQYNARPTEGERWRIPPLALGLKTLKGREVLYAAVATFPTAGSQEQGRAVALPGGGSAPIRRDRSHRIGIEFVDGGGGDGRLKVTVDGETLVAYDGPTGYANFAGCFFSYGLYRSPWCPGGEDLAVSFETLREGRA